MIHTGIDLHANNMVIVAINGNGVIREAKLPTSTRALEDFFDTFDEPVQAVVAWTILAEIGDIHRFPQCEAVCKLLSAGPGGQ